MISHSISEINNAFPVKSKEFLVSLETFVKANYLNFNKTNIEPLTLLSGLSGTALFYGYLWKVFDSQQFADECNEIINICISRINEIEQPSLYEGFTGIAWTIRHLVDIGVFESSSLEGLEGFDGHIEKSLDTFYKHGYYSLMYGSIGHGVYFLEVLKSKDAKPQDRERAFNALSKIVCNLDEISIKSPDGITWIDNTSLDYHEKHKVIHNLGLPHGITGIASFLSEMLALNIQVRLSRKLLEGCLNWLISRKENFSGISNYPSLIIDNEPTKQTRLSWAYGDLCASLALLKGFKLLNVARYRDEAKETLLLSTKRNLDNSLIHNKYSENLLNKGICQGTWGIVLLLSELNNYFNDQLVTESIGYWVNLTLSGNKNFNEGFLKTFTTREGELKWELSTGFLDGLSGIGLVLMSLSNPSLNKWKRLLLI